MQKPLLSILLLFGLVIGATAQYAGTNQHSGVGIPFFELGYQQGFAQNLTDHRLVIMSHHLYDDLTFVKSDTNGFETRFEMLFAVYDQDGNVLTSHTINRHLRVATFEETNARNRSVIVKDQFVLPAGQYTLLARSTDLVTNKSAKRKIKLKFADYSAQPVALGSLMFLRDVQVDSSGRVVDFTPTFSNNFTVKSGKFYILYDLFVRRTDQPVTLHYKFEGERARSKKKELEIDSTLTVKPDQAVSQQLFELNRQYLRHNKYLLSVEARVGDTLARTNQTFSFFWSSVPTTLADIDLALRQMSYILNADTLKYYLAADFAQKQAFFQRFWKERDPDPTTRKNELKDEYFKRVNYANNHFSTMSQDGWATDRGRILIKFGYPDDIERHPFEIDTAPYEVWQYYSLRKTFLFIDYTGFGDYRLDPRYFNMEFE